VNTSAIDAKSSNTLSTIASVGSSSVVEQDMQGTVAVASNLNLCGLEAAGDLTVSVLRVLDPLTWSQCTHAHLVVNDVLRDITLLAALRVFTSHHSAELAAIPLTNSRFVTPGTTFAVTVGIDRAGIQIPNTVGGLFVTAKHAACDDRYGTATLKGFATIHPVL
jgi:hypothetical protein